ncbi:MAG: RNase adapter RapZ [Gammaproteobacteria bacterium]|nr:RNase adapter RapZ [Gammaproteobacteria bacterium]MDH5659895.1 RNase adapter RapZ [Gammaproteobacteria bacterium]
MKLVIVSGLSGSGKSIALQVLEDLEYYCIDNLPINMLEALTKEIISAKHEYVAVGIDARNVATELEHFPQQIKQLQKNNIDCEIFFLEASSAALIKRFSETRRKHPLSNKETPLNEAIIQERYLLEPISSKADLRIDTSSTNVHQLRDLIKARVKTADSQSISIMFESFGFKHGVPINSDFVFDIRCLPNPHWVPELRSLTGFDEEVINYLDEYDEVNEMLTDIMEFMDKWIPRFEADNRSYISIAIGCTGGQHRSVYLVNKLAKMTKNKHNTVLSRHREIS